MLSNRIALLLIAVISTIACGCSSSPRAAQPLTVMTYNIHHGEGTDKRLDLERIAKVIGDTRPDLVALQELDADTNRTNHVMQAKELARLLKMHYVFGPAMDHDGGKYGDAVLSRYEIVTSRVIALPYTPGERREPRVAVETIVQVPGGRELAFISTHLDHTAKSPDRLPQATAINEQLAHLKEPAILAGDFNCQPDDPPMRELAREWTMVGNGEGDGATYIDDVRRIKIDHILVKPKDAFHVVEARVIDDRVASDHRPVVVKLKLVD